MRSWLLLPALVAAAGCSWIEAANPFSETAAQKRKAAELPALAAQADLRLLWKNEVGAADQYAFVPAVVGDAVFAAAADGTLTRFDAGRQVWRVSAGQRLSAGVGSDGKLLVVGTAKGEVLAFDTAGKPLWKARVSSEVLAAPVLGEGLVVVRSGDSRVYAFDAADGKRRWVYQRATPALTLRSNGGLALTDKLVIAGFPGGKLVAISLANGGAVWEATVALPKGATELERIADVVGTPAALGRGVCAVAFQGRVACFDAGNGNLQWAKEVSSSVGLDADARQVFVTDERGALRAYDRDSGASVWKQDALALRNPGRPLVAGGYVAVADRYGFVHLLRREDGALAARLAADSAPVLAEMRRTDSGLVAQSARGAVVALDTP